MMTITSDPKPKNQNKTKPKQKYTVAQCFISQILLDVNVYVCIC